jgi:hypothetical protein
MRSPGERSGPHWAAEYAVLLCALTQGRLCSAAEIGKWMAELGFRIVARSDARIGRLRIDGHSTD